MIKNKIVKAYKVQLLTKNLVQNLDNKRRLSKTFKNLKFKYDGEGLFQPIIKPNKKKKTKVKRVR